MKVVLGCFTIYFASSLLSDVSVLSHHAHTRSTHGILIALFLYPRPPSSPPPTQDPVYGNMTALIVAAIWGRVECVKALVAADPDRAHLNMKVSIT